MFSLRSISLLSFPLVYLVRQAHCKCCICHLEKWAITIFYSYTHIMCVYIHSMDVEACVAVWLKCMYLMVLVFVLRDVCMRACVLRARTPLLPFPSIFGSKHGHVDWEWGSSHTITIIDPRHHHPCRRQQPLLLLLPPLLRLLLLVTAPRARMCVCDILLRTFT